MPALSAAGWTAADLALLRVMVRQFDGSTALVALIDAASGHFIEVNEAFLRCFGGSRAGLRERAAADLNLLTEPAQGAELWQRLRTNACLGATRLSFNAAGGNIVDGEMTCELISIGGGHQAVFAMLQNVQPAGVASIDATALPDILGKLSDTVSEGLYRRLPDGALIDANQALANLLGYDSPAQLLADSARTPSMVYVDRAQALEFARVSARGVATRELKSRIYRRDGSIIWVAESVRPVFGRDRSLSHIEGSIVDISTEVDAMQASADAMALVAAVSDASCDGMFALRDGRLVMANAALGSLLGYSQDELRGKALIEITSRRDHAALKDLLEHAQKDRAQAHALEIALICAKGRTHPVELRLAPCLLSDGATLVGVVRELGRRKAQDARVEAAEQAYRTIFEQSPVGLFRANSAGEVLEVNQTLATQLGYADPQDLRTRIRLIADTFTDLGLLRVITQNLLTRKALHRLRVPLIRKDQSRVWVEATLVLRDDPIHGEIVTGSVVDVSEQVLAESAREHSEARYRALVEHSQVGVFIIRLGRYSYVNRAFAQMLGFDESSLIGRRTEELIAADQHGALIEAFRGIGGDKPAPGAAERNAAQGVDFETCFVASDGAQVHATISAGALVIDGEIHISGTARDITRQRQSEMRLRFEASHDLLTRLPNRSLFNERLNQTLVAAAHSSRYDYALLFLDLDGFKLINDGLGHAVGDRLLVAIAERLTEALAGEAVLARYGGDEFTVLPTGACDRLRAEELARRLLGELSDGFLIDGQRLYTGASCGVVLARPEYQSTDQLMRDADIAMYRAKAQGKSGYVVFDETMQSAAQARFQLETDLRPALRNGELRVYFQPLVELRSGAIVGCEALIRWQHPKRGLLLPAEFMAVAEESGLVRELDWWVLDQSCGHLARWQEHLGDSDAFRVNINIGERQLGEVNLPLAVEQVLKRWAIAPQQLVFEVTETAFRNGRDRVAHGLEALRNLGVGLVLDDFGTGYSSLGAFTDAPFDGLKLDRSFVADMIDNPRHDAIVRTIVALASALGLRLVAEGVETELQAKRLAEIGVQFGQGFRYSPALAPEVFEQLLKARRVLIPA